MQFRRALATLSLTLLVLAGCAPETTAPLGSSGDGGSTLGFPAAVGSVADLRSDLERLATRTVPNPSAFLSKFDNLVLAIPGNDFGSELLDLLNFLENQVQVRYLQPPRRGNLTDCVTPPNGVPNCETVGKLYDDVVAGIMAMVGLSSGPNTTICVLPDGHTSEFCRAPESGGQGTGFVFFPAALFDKLTFVSVKSLGDEASVNSGLDEYGFTVEIRTAPVTQFGAVRPTVVACVAPSAGLDETTLDRLLLGHRRAGLGGAFSLLPEADAAIEAEAIDYCGPASSGPSVFGLSPESPLSRLLVGARDLFLPAQLSASNAVMLATRGFSGASGSPEEFSTFRAVDRGVTGAGGSPEEFAPQAGAETPTPALSGAAGTSATSGLPFVIVQTPNGGIGVAGVKVTFSLGTPGQGLTESNASLCDGEPTTATTGSDGKATLPCLNFGPMGGYKNLQVTFDPTEVLTGNGFEPGEELCMLRDGVCDNSVTADFLIETVASEPAPDWGASGYRYLRTTLGGGPAGFEAPSFNDAGWDLGSAPFGSMTISHSCSLFNQFPPVTNWPLNSDILVRKQFSMPAAGQVSIQVAIDNDVQVYLNGVDVSGGLKTREGCATRPALNNAFTFPGQALAGENVLAIRARDRGVISYLDIRVAPVITAVAAP